MFKKIVIFFDKLEDGIRARLSHSPILYSIIAAIGIVLVWKGVWETAEYFPVLYGPVSFVLGAVILLMTGLLVSFFIGDSILISGLKREKKLVEETETDVRSEKEQMTEINETLSRIEKEVHVLKEVEEHAHKHHN